MVKVTKGVIAAAGRGTRFLPVTKAYPKELIAILDKPNIQYLVEEMIGAGINQINIVHRPNDEKLRQYFTPDKELESFLKENNKEFFLASLEEIWKKAKIYFTPQDPNLPYGNASPILSVKNFVGNDPFVYMFGDDIVVEDKPGNYLSRLIKIYQQYQPAVILGAQEVPWEEIDRYASIKYLNDPQYPNRATEVLEKLSADQAPSNIAQFGRFVISNKIFPVLAKQGLSRDNELWLADANNTLAKNDVAIAEPISSGQWLTTGDPLRWLKVNLVFALKDPEIAPEIKNFFKKPNI
ncbi:MAG: sugar phosphate nucleotidyltransferase [Candidatus Shapirobacteria bacterium]|nr:sugar phosphate nucleotidyltransferase [Candidatus Shapirobacteria bacterium]